MYYWGIVLPFETVLVLVGLSCINKLSEIRQALTVGSLFAVVLLLAPRWPSNPAVSYGSYMMSWGRRLSRTETRAGFLRQFVGGFDYSYAAVDAIGRVILTEKRPGDMLHVYGFEPVPYVISGLRSPSRFFAEFPLIDPRLAYRRSDWLAQHLRSIADAPPRFVVDFDCERNRIQYRIEIGYRQRAKIARYVLLEKD
jgi:hypothetical protein